MREKLPTYAALVAMQNANANEMHKSNKIEVEASFLVGRSIYCSKFLGYALDFDFEMMQDACIGMMAGDN